MCIGGLSQNVVEANAGKRGIVHCPHEYSTKCGQIVILCKSPSAYAQ